MATSLSSAIDAKEIVEDTSDRYHMVRQAMERMVDEISMAYVSPHQAAPELRAKSGFLGERDELQFTAFGHVVRRAEAKESDSRQLGYFLGPDERTGEESILRRIQPNLDEEFDEGGREQTLLPGVRDLEFEYWDGSKEEWTDSWDIENAQYQGLLPGRVKITFTAVMENEREQTFTSQTRLWLIRPQAFK